MKSAEEVMEILAAFDLTGSLRDDPAAVRAAAEQQLVPLGLVRVGPDGGWVLSPVAGRYRPTDGQP